MRPPAIRCFGLSKRFDTVQAVAHVDLAVDHGQMLVLLGPSGCGKTTLLRLIAGFDLPDAGTLAVGGQMVSGPNYLVPPERRRVGMVFQDYALFPHLDVWGNLIYGIRRDPDRTKRVWELLELVHLDGMEHRMPHELSGGEQQRVALARALAPRPAVVLLDEPFSNLDTRLRARVRAEVRQILTEAGATSVFVTHDQEEALFLGDQIAVMNQGSIEQVDAPDIIFHRPATPFVARLLGIADFLEARVEGDVLLTEVGILPRPPEVGHGVKVEIMVRPGEVSIYPDETSQALVIDRVFQGDFYLYLVRLPSGAVIHSLMRYYDTFDVGMAVTAHIDPDHPLVCFVDGHISPIPLME